MLGLYLASVPFDLLIALNTIIIIIIVQSTGSPNLGDKDQHQDRGGTNEKPSAEDSGKTIDNPLQSVGGDDDDCQYNAGDIDGCCNVLGIVQALYLHFACCKG